MATSGEWHEGYDKLSEETKNFSRAIKSIQEELEAVDWYNQRAAMTKDPQLKKILEHNRNEEIEHESLVATARLEGHIGALRSIALEAWLALEDAAGRLRVSAEALCDV